MARCAEFRGQRLELSSVTGRFVFLPPFGKFRPTRPRISLLLPTLETG
jgi:hypothetical protein